MVVILSKIRIFLLLLILPISSEINASNRMLELGTIGISATIPLYSSVSVSNNEISFEILGTPGEYIATDIVTLSIESNQHDWGVYAKSSNLAHKDFGVAPLSANRLSFSVNGGEFTSLQENELFLKSGSDKEQDPVELRFKLTTTWEDTPGVYKGKITIAFFNNP